MSFENIPASAAIERGEHPSIILQRVKENYPAWDQTMIGEHQVEIKRLNGLSNACYKVSLRDEVQLPDGSASRDILYRKFECEVVDKNMEAALFKSMAEAGIGPGLIHQADAFRIEKFFQGRPLTIWEMRNPVVVEEFVTAIFSMHTNRDACEAI